jgi:hypothetical protein
MSFKGAFDASEAVEATWQTALKNSAKGDMYAVSVAGSPQNGGNPFFSVTLEVGDVLISETALGVDDFGAEGDWIVLQKNLTDVASAAGLATELTDRAAADDAIEAAAGLTAAGAFGSAIAAETNGHIDLSTQTNLKGCIETLAADADTAIEAEEVRALAAEVANAALAAANEVHIDNAVTLSGVAKDQTHLSTFTGATIADNQTVKAALQALETGLEAGGGAVGATDVNAIINYMNAALDVIRYSSNSADMPYEIEADGGGNVASEYAVPNNLGSGNTTGYADAEGIDVSLDGMALSSGGIYATQAAYETARDSAEGLDPHDFWVQSQSVPAALSSTAWASSDIADTVIMVFQPEVGSMLRIESECYSADLHENKATI